MMCNMLEGIDIEVGCEKDEWKNYNADLTIFTGRVDHYFNNVYGELPYRTLEFNHKFTSQKLTHAIINQNTAEVPYTRKYDHSFCNFKHSGPTIITEEYSKTCQTNDIPFYPMPFGDGLKVYSQYKQLADKESNVIFIGRLATYTYLDMWMSIKQAMIKIKSLNL